MQDNSYEKLVPESYPLLVGERLISIKHHPPIERIGTPSSIEQIKRLTQSIAYADIGHRGPSMAALPMDAEGAPEHLRLYETLFGRDSLRTAIDLIPSFPELAKSTVFSLAELQGVSSNIQREEEPGRIVHEARDASDPIAVELSERLGWGWPYYGSVDATPELIRTLTAYIQHPQEGPDFLWETYTDRNNETQPIHYALDKAVDWIETRRSQNAEGLLEFQSVIPKGIENQVWKDSWDAYHHTDGSLANHKNGIASIEVQVTAYDALLDAANLYETHLSNPQRAQELRESAEAFRETILELFWTEEKGGYFVLGTDRDEDGTPRQLKIRTSNMGHALNSRLLEDSSPRSVKMREATVQQLMSPEMLNISGIRTLASDELRFRPGAYHNGSVWLWDTHHIAKGLRRHGYETFATDIDRRILYVVETTKLFPEYVRGDSAEKPSINESTVVIWDELNKRENKVEQPPQEVQAWTVAAILATKLRFSRK